VVLRMKAARSPRAAGGASDVDCEERHTKRGRWSHSSPKVSRSRGPFGSGRGQQSCVGTCPKGCGCERGRSGFARAELWASAKRQEDGCTGESMLPPNTDDGNCVGPHGPSRRSGRSRCMSSSIGLPVKSCAAYPQLAKQNTECSAAYPQLAKQTLALCASGVQPEMRPSVAGAKA